jgi:hypothetical protein
MECSDTRIRRHRLAVLSARPRSVIVAGINQGLATPQPDTDRERPAVPTYDAGSRARTLILVSCSLCLRVLHDSHWIDARDAIRKLRRFELPTVVHLEPGCATSAASSSRGAAPARRRIVCATRRDRPRLRVSSSRGYGCDLACGSRSDSHVIRRASFPRRHAERRSRHRRRLEPHLTPVGHSPGVKVRPRMDALSARLSRRRTRGSLRLKTRCSR